MHEWGDRVPRGTREAGRGCPSDREPVMTQWMLLSALTVLVAFIVIMMIARYARLRRVFVTVATSLCDPDTWHITFFVRTFVIKGEVQGYPMRFSASGDVRGSVPAYAYLLLEHPVQGNFRFFQRSDSSLIHPKIRAQIEVIQQVPDFDALIVTSGKTPLLAKVLARPLGLGYRPGLLMCTLGKSGFNPDALQRNVSLLIELAQHGA
jgi:hypothetical protein